jgi:hypothetical protein
VSCGVVFSRVRFKRSGQEISNIVILDNSKVVVGLPESAVGKTDQRITGVRTKGGSIAVVDVYSSAIGWKNL